jgi:Arc/MetJ family transcription regulator
MNTEDAAAPVRRLAARLIARGRDEPDAPQPATVALERLSAELCRWIGDEGCRVLLSRALTRTQRDRPPLVALRVDSATPPVLTGVDEVLEAHGPAAIAAGIEEVMIAVLDLLRRLIGEDLTTRLAERSMADTELPAISRRERGRRPNG